MRKPKRATGPVLLKHMPMAIAIDFSDPDQRWHLRCTCGATWHDRQAGVVRRMWAEHVEGELND